MKTIFREVLAMIVIVAAIGLIITLIFFDYIKADSSQPQAAIYETSKKEKSILEEKKQYEEDKETLVLSSSYSIGENELSSMKASGEFKQGQSSPFDEIPITDIRVDSEGNVYYQTGNTTTTNNNTTNNSTNNTTNNTNTNSTNTTNNNTNTNSTNKDNQTSSNGDITSPSESSGNMQTTQKVGGGK